MSDAFWVSIAPSIIALGTLIAAIASWRTSAKNSAKNDVIIGHVNSAATKAAGEIAALRQVIVLMREQAADKKETAALLAQAAASATSQTLTTTEIKP